MSLKTLGAYLGLFVLVSGVSAIALSSDRRQPERKEAGKQIDLSEYRLTFNEEFDSIDVSAWGPNTRWIAHTPWRGDFGRARFVNPKPGFPFSVKGGILRIEARKGKDGKWRSGLLSGVDGKYRGFWQKYGYFEMRAKFPSGVGMLPAFWLISRFEGQTGEIDIIEHHGWSPASFASTVHVWDHRNPKNTRTVGKGVKLPAGSLYDRFNTFGASVDQDWIVIYFNRKEVWRTPAAPIHRQPKFILLNLGGNHHLNGSVKYGETSSPQIMEVDYVKVWSKMKLKKASHEYQ